MKSISPEIVVGAGATVRLDAKGEVDVGESYGAYESQGTKKFSEQPAGYYPLQTKMRYGLAVRHLPLLGVIAILIFTATYTRGQSTDETRPTPIAAFPITGNLGSGTYYYQMAQSRVVPGTGNATLELTPPDGGGSMTVTFSGPSCCPPDAYIGITTGLADPMREAARFDIPREQPLLITVYISVGAEQTVRFRLDFNIVKSGDGGIIVTPPTPTPTPTPRPMLTPATPTPCTDLAITDFSVVEVARGRKVIKGQLRNLSPTAFLAGHSRGQYVAVYDISTAGMEPPLVGHWRFAGVPANGALNFHVEHVFTPPRSHRYEVRIVYLPLVATNRSTTDDDCNESNNSTRSQSNPDDVLTPTTPVIPQTSPAPPCTDLGLAHFRVEDVTRNRRVIKSVIGNLSTTPFKGYPRNQYVAVYDISASAKEPPLVGFFRFTEVPARGTLEFSVEHSLTTPRRTRYEVRIVYLPGTATNRIISDDDCNSENNSTRRQLIEGGDVLVDELP